MGGFCANWCYSLHSCSRSIFKQSPDFLLECPRVIQIFWGNEEYNLIYSTIPRTLHLNPFSIETVNISGNTIPASIQQKLYKYTWQAAICLMSKNSPPSWYQIDLEINDKLLKAANANSTINPQENGDLIKIKRTSGYLPTVAWNGFGELEWG